jgi:hypothetical protein
MFIKFFSVLFHIEIPALAAVLSSPTLLHQKKSLPLKFPQVTFFKLCPEKSSTAVPCLKGQSFEQSA